MQHECQRFQFRRETYYLCQSYIDSYLSGQEMASAHLKLLGIACLQIAMKIEEVDIRDVKASLSALDKIQLEKMERQIVTQLKFKLFPDTLYFWFDLAVKLWDTFISQQDEISEFSLLFKPTSSPLNVTNKYLPSLNAFKLGVPNPYRTAVQALDLMSLHFKIHDFARPNLILGLLAVHFLSQVNLLDIYPYHNVAHLQRDIKLWASSQADDGPNPCFELFRKFLEQFCAEMLPENFETASWAQLLCQEMCFACQFFTFPTQFHEPAKR